MDDVKRSLPPDAIDLADLAVLADTTPAGIQALVTLGLLTPLPDGRLRRRDAHQARIATAFLAAGVPIEALMDATARGRIEFESYHELHPDPGVPSPRTYATFRHDLGAPAEGLSAVFAALGLAEPRDKAHLTLDEEALLSTWIGLLDGLADRDLAIRLLRLLGESARRSAEASLDVYIAAAMRLGHDPTSVPVETYSALVARWAAVARELPGLSGWLLERHLRRAIDGFSVETTEQILAAEGDIPVRVRALPAVAFVDLTGFTRATQLGGDEAAADLSLRLGDVAMELVAAVDGRLVKLLGDGALLKFHDVRSALSTTVALLDALPAAGLPGGHAGIHHGQIIEREGDVFGRTVNLAARLSDKAPDGEIYVTGEVVAAVTDDGFTFAPAGEADLQGIGPTPLFRLIRG